MLNFDFRKTSKKCSKSERILQPGEEFYSALIGDENESQRLDFAVENWDGPPPNCLGWWKSKIPAAEKGKVYWLPRAELLAHFDLVRQQSERADEAYVMALLLVQKKVLTVVDSFDESETATLQLRNRKDNLTYEIPIVDVEPQRMMEIQAEFAERLFADHLYDTEEGEAEPEEDDIQGHVSDG